MCLTTLFFYSWSQILFKDLFRFLLVYVLFMIGYASGRCLVTELYRCVQRHSRVKFDICHVIFKVRTTGWLNT